jgi:solute carrier family 13 (sodium-dependent dicarboxylate transporter), member 2/3/5
VSLAIALVAAAVPWFVQIADLSPAGHRQLSIFLFAVVAWVTEAIPLHATAAVIIAAEVALVSDQAVIALPEGFDAPSYTDFYGTLANPVVILFLGGFVLAGGAAKFSLDKNLARILLRPFGGRPTRLMLGIMVITAGLSMFMSNTATTATMLAVVLPVIVNLPPGDKARVSLALCVPVAANIGGIGTPVGTPPNAVAVSALAKAGYSLTFLDWMLLAVPFMVIVLFAAWVALCRLFPATITEIEVRIDSTFDRSRPALILYTAAAATVILWLTEPLHAVPAAVVAFGFVAVLLATRVFTAEDLQHVQWHVLWLVAGGIALGDGVAATGLDDWIVGLLAWENLPAWALAGVLALVAIAGSTVISNSATANLLIPIGLVVASSAAVAIDPLLAGILIAMGCSLAMALPISTPPNAIAYATGQVSTTHMALIGGIVAVVGLATFAYLAPPVWRALGLL